MRRWSIVHPYFNHESTLMLQIGLWRQLYSIEVELIVVDDHSDKPIDIEPFKSLKFPVRVLRVEDDIPWNVTGARNIGASKATCPYLIMADFDCGVTPGLLKYLRPEHSEPIGERDILFPALQFNDNSRKYKPFGKIGEPHCNSFIISTNFYREIGGYDEDFAGGWGYEDSYFHGYLAKFKGAQPKILQPPKCFRYFQGHNFGAYTCGRVNEGRNAQIFLDKITRRDYENGPGKTLRSNYVTLYQH